MINKTKNKIYPKGEHAVTILTGFHGTYNILNDFAKENDFKVYKEQFIKKRYSSDNV